MTKTEIAVMETRIEKRWKPKPNSLLRSIKVLNLLLVESGVKNLRR